MDARRLELYELLKPTLGEDPAQKLVLALSPDPQDIATNERLDSRFREFGAQMDARFAHLEASVDSRFAKVDARFDRLENLFTRRMVTILGAWTGIAVALAAALR